MTVAPVAIPGPVAIVEPAGTAEPSGIAGPAAIGCLRLAAVCRAPVGPYSQQGPGDWSLRIGLACDGWKGTPAPGK